MKVYELEQNIMDTWNIVDDMRMIVERLSVDNIDPKQLKETVELLESLLVVYDFKFNRCYGKYCQLLKEGSDE